MSFNKTVTLLACILGGLCTQSAVAADSSINITGNVVASPCTVDSGTKNATIDLYNVQATDLAAAGATSSWSATLTLKLINCPATTSKITATFNGTPDPIWTQGYKNLAAGGSSAVAIEFADVDGTLMSNGAQMADRAMDAGNKKEFYVKARMHTKNGSVAPGAVSTVVSVTFTYK